jgi:hypothetical protein
LLRPCCPKVVEPGRSAAGFPSIKLAGMASVAGGAGGGSAGLAETSVTDILTTFLVVSSTTLPRTGTGSLFTKRLVVGTGGPLGIHHGRRVSAVGVVSSGGGV